MNEEITKVTMKIPLFEDGELEKIDSFTSEIARAINGKVLKEKDMIIAQRLIYNLQTRIDKAIEFLKENACYDDEDFSRDLIYYDCRKLLDILKGSDKNGKTNIR